MRHELKTDPRPFAAVWDGTKLYEIRKDDRVRHVQDPNGTPGEATPYAVDDKLLLRETRFSAEQMKGGRQLEYTGRLVLCVVTHKLTGYGLQDGWCILGIRRVELIQIHGPNNDAHYKPEQPESFVNVMPSLSVPEIEYKYWDVKTRHDPAHVPSEGSQYIGTKITDMPKGFNANKTATALAVAWDAEGMPYCFAHGRNTHVMGCKTCEVSLHARCSMADKSGGTRAAGAFAIVHSLGYEWVDDVWAIDNLRAGALAELTRQWPYSPNNASQLKLTTAPHPETGTLYVTLDDMNHPDTRKVNVPNAVDRRIDAKLMSNKSGGHVSYYSVDVDVPSKGGAPYRAEAIDVIASLDMTFAEGEAFKAVWRCAADRCGAHKDGNDTRRDAEKVAYYGEQMTAREKKRHG